MDNFNSLSKLVVEDADTFDDDKIEKELQIIIKNYDRIMNYPRALKDKIMRKYGVLSEMKVTVYRYNVLQKQGFQKDAEQEAERLIRLVNELGKVGTFAESDTVLKGRVEKTEGVKYVWVSNGGCAACDALDGQEFEEGEVPEAPHPNCQCTVEAVEGEDGDENEPCTGCEELFDTETQELEDMIGDAENLISEIETAIDEFLDFLNDNFIEPVKEVVSATIDALEQIIGTVGDFIQNYFDMRGADTKYADKYFHAKANCNGAQRGEIGEAVAKGLSDLREYSDHFADVYIKGKSEAESARDSAEDQEANEYGREQGKKYPDEACEVLIEILRPRGLPERY
ncbi:hypothetical protein tpqmel_0763 [Candidatus Gastranaerophilus sp. (ex Termes propinquus)]|nr:hypothetical protein tpqmel_0763 [Candidatus Gastranaerophilus sp. (ex Termes propinquus)]